MANTTLIDIISQLLNRPDADDIRLNDGADTWDLYNLYDAIAQEDDGGDYTEIDGDIYEVKADGYIGNRIYRRIDAQRSSTMFQLTNCHHNPDAVNETFETIEDVAAFLAGRYGLTYNRHQTAREYLSLFCGPGETLDEDNIPAYLADDDIPESDRERLAEFLTAMISLRAGWDDAIVDNTEVDGRFYRAADYSLTQFVHDCAHDKALELVEN